MIHPTAIIDPNAKLGQNVTVGPYSIIKGMVSIGDNVQIASHVLIEGNTTIGKNCQIFHSAAIGCVPQDLKFHNETTYLTIGDSCVVREFVTINLATGEGKATRIGDNNLLMAYVHIAHNCILGQHVILGNAVNLAGHVTIEDFAIVGGMTPIHQFVQVGAHCMVGGASRISKDVLPYTRVGGSPLVISGLNTVGLQRRGFSKEATQCLKQAYKLIYRENLNVSQALERIKKTVEKTVEIDHLIQFIEKSERGISK